LHAQFHVAFRDTYALAAACFSRPFHALRQK
jgi:hypothetical protein